jgi:hypothetical protein
MPLGCALGIITAICAGLHHVHELTAPDGEPLGLVHRDVSPGNVLVGFDGHVKVVDFGIAKAAGGTNATRTGVVKGKLGYMSPEQCLARPLDRRSDVFNIGILMYELTVGKRLFRADSEFTVMNRIISGDFPRPSEIHPYYPAALERMVMRALNPAPDKRFPTAEDLRSEIVAFERQSDLDLSAGPIAQWMARLFGPQPVPTVDAIPELEDTRDKGRSPLRAAVPWVAATAAFLLGAIVWEQARPTPDAREAATTEPLNASAMVSEPVAAAVPSADAMPKADAIPKADAMPKADAIPSVAVMPSADAAPTAEATPGSVASSTKPSTKRRRTKTTRTRTKSAKDDRWRSTLPPSLRGSK